MVSLGAESNQLITTQNPTHEGRLSSSSGYSCWECDVHCLRSPNTLSFWSDGYLTLIRVLVSEIFRVEVMQFGFGSPFALVKLHLCDDCALWYTLVCLSRFDRGSHVGGGGGGIFKSMIYIVGLVPTALSFWVRWWIKILSWLKTISLHFHDCRYLNRFLHFSTLPTLPSEIPRASGLIIVIKMSQ